MSNPDFQIHRIKRMTDGKAFNCWRYWGSPRTGSYWSDEGVFFRRMETIRKHLKWMRDGDKMDLNNLYVETYSVRARSRAVSAATAVLPAPTLAAQPTATGGGE